MKLLQRRLWLDVFSAAVESWSSFGCVIEDTFIVMIGLGLREKECGGQLVAILVFSRECMLRWRSIKSIK